MDGTTSAAIQIGSIVVSTGAVGALVRMAAPFIIRLWQESRQLELDKQRQNTELKIDHERLKKENLELSMRHTTNMVDVLRGTVNLISERLKSHEEIMKSSNANIEQLMDYKVVWEYFKQIKDTIEAKKKINSADSQTASNPLSPAKPFPEQEHIKRGDMEIIRDKKPDGAK